MELPRYFHYLLLTCPSACFSITGKTTWARNAFAAADGSAVDTATSSPVSPFLVSLRYTQLRKAVYSLVYTYVHP